MMPRQPTPRFRPGRQASRRALARGFSLIELIVVIVVGGIISAAVSIFIKPAINSFLDIRVRTDLSDQGDTVLRRMLRDVRHAVPNSLRVPSDQCFEMVPTITGGRYRMGPDITNDSATCPGSGTCAAYVDPTQATTSFDTLSPMATTPAVGDWVVINNQNGNDVYAGTNRSNITAVAASPVTTQGYSRLTIASMQVSQGYNGGRFMVVRNTEQSVFYICSGADGSVNSSGNGKGTLYRLVRSFTATYPTACPAISGAVAMANNVKTCSFVYDPNQGATQQSGFLWMDLELTRNNETAHMAVGAHVMNVP
jgi:MSHA biogenesis protein MshO